MKILMIINDAPYGSEHRYNGLRLAGSLAKHEETDIKIFLIGDAVSGAHKGQKVPQGYYNVQTMLSAVIRRAGFADSVSAAAVFYPPVQHALATRAYGTIERFGSRCCAWAEAFLVVRGQRGDRGTNSA